jgi:tetratricopeptide (TPR) repeat protein
MRALGLLFVLLGAGVVQARETYEIASAERLFSEWRFERAIQALANAIKHQPAEPTTQAAQGYERFMAGDFISAAAHYRAAVQSNPRNLLWKEHLELAEKSAAVVRSFEEKRSEHFIFRFAPEDRVLADYGLETLEAALAALRDDLGYEPSRPIPVDIVRSAADLADMTSLSEEEIERTGTVAVSKWTRVMLTTPRSMRLGYEWRDSLAHEYVHYVISAMTFDRAPVWLQEGMAKFMDHRWRAPAGLLLNPSSQHFLAKALASGKLIGFEAMHPSMAKLPRASDAALAFAEVTTAMACLFHQSGMEAFRDVLTDVRGGADARLAVARAFGGSGAWADFERSWKSFMVGLRYKTLPGKEAPIPQYRKKTASQKAAPSEDEAEVGNYEEERYLRLGNMLLLRNRAKAASVEYEKGAKIAGTAQWLYAVKLGRTYLALRRPAEAQQAVAPARELYPELPWPHLIAGQAILAQNNPKQAIPPLLAAIGTNPFDPSVHCALADAYSRLPNTAPVTKARAERDCRELGKN